VDHSNTALAHHFDNMEQQREAGTLGMWLFLITEIMFFGGLFLAYVVYRGWYAEAFAHASHHLSWKLGAFNTAVLICSSLTMAMAVYSAQISQRRGLVIYLLLTILLGSVFLGVKVVEYYDKFTHHLVPGVKFQYEVAAQARPAELFYSLYFAMTGLHALHMIIGIGILAVLMVQSAWGKFSGEYHAPVEMTGLYWHFVDIVWIFLFPLLYLIARHQ